MKSYTIKNRMGRKGQDVEFVVDTRLIEGKREYLIKYKLKAKPEWIEIARQKEEIKAIIEFEIARAKIAMGK